MTTVRVLIEGVGEWKQGEVVTNAPKGLVDMAEKKTRNAATNQLIAEFVEDDEQSELLDQLRARAKELKIKGAGNMKLPTLQVAVAAAEDALESKGSKDNDPTQTTPGTEQQGTNDQTINGSQGGTVGDKPDSEQ